MLWPRQARKAARRKRVVKYPVMAVIWVAVISIVLRKLLLDHSLVSQQPTGLKNLGADGENLAGLCVL